MSNTSLKMRSLRGATTASANTAAAMTEAVDELLDALISNNGLQGDQVLSATFSVTADLDAMFPASLARRRPPINSHNTIKYLQACFHIETCGIHYKDI